MPKCDTARFLCCHFKDFILSSVSYKGVLIINNKEANTSWSSCKMSLYVKTLLNEKCSGIVSTDFFFFTLDEKILNFFKVS